MVQGIQGPTVTGARILSRGIRWYQKHVSPRFPPRCRYYPSCSQYALEAMHVHGGGKGTLLATWRILRCNPWSKGGADYVPERGAWPGKPLGHEELLRKWKEGQESSAASNDFSSGEDTVPHSAQQNTNFSNEPQAWRNTETRKS
ncbi:membrane protein insertion efficiency factor YidD [Flaviflexus equikiangi]|uniref:membrane protein insertion efficiency factor YidD n=1 Tax=Flaviflexus equikiangi TaxID=2758573 RepID=UPI0015F60D4B|nr:membrane protein insertion efficiency factor YidD [Flaviflexus equikiangi]